MKKHILGVLAVLLVGCLGIGVLAACGGDNDPDGTGPETTYTLKYDKDGADGTVPADAEYAAGTKVTVDSGTGLSKTNYDFDGWLDGTTAVEAGSQYTMPARDVTLKAKWVPVGETVTKYTVAFSFGSESHAATGVNVPASQTDKAVGDEITLTSPAAADGWAFDYWSSKTISKIEGTTYTVAAADAENGTITLTAHWKSVPTTFTVEFSFGSESHAAENAPLPQSQANKAVGDEITLTSPDAADGWEFGGWTVKSGAISGTTYTVAAADAEGSTITITATWTSIVPTVALDKGEATGTAPTITPVRNGSTYDITFPENTLTAPTGTYFRGYTYNGKTYFPGESVTGIAEKATVNVAVVWADLAVTSEETSVIGVWGGAPAAQEVILRRGNTIKLEVTYSALGADPDNSTAFAGINVQVVNGIEFFFLRTDVEGALITNNIWSVDDPNTPAKWRNASGRLVAHEVGSDVEKWAIAENYHDNTDTQITADAWLAAKLAGRTVIEVKFEGDDKVVVTETYYTDKTGDTVYVAFAYTLSGLTAPSYSVFFAAQQGTTVATSKLTTEAVSQNQAPTAEDTVSFIGGLYYVAGWTTEIRKGETLELKGKATPQVDTVWRGYVASISATLGAADIFRMDNYILGTNAAAPTTNNGFSYTYQQTETNMTQITAQEYDTTVKVDWATDQTNIVITLTIGEVTTTWTIAAESGDLANSYYFNLGADCCAATFTSITRTAQTTPAAAE